MKNMETPLIAGPNCRRRTFPGFHLSVSHVLLDPSYLLGDPLRRELVRLHLCYGGHGCAERMQLGERSRRRDRGAGASGLDQDAQSEGREN